MKSLQQSLIFTLLILFSACGKDDPSVEEGNSNKKVVEVIITFGSNHSSYGANFGLQVASTDGGLSDNFKFIGINSTPSIVQDASVIHQATLFPITSASQSIKTSEPVSTFTISTIATNLSGSSSPLIANYDFYIDGKKTVSKEMTFTPNNFAAKVLVVDTANPDRAYRTLVTHYNTVALEHAPMLQCKFVRMLHCSIVIMLLIPNHNNKTIFT